MEMYAERCTEGMHLLQEDREAAYGQFRCAANQDGFAGRIEGPFLVTFQAFLFVVFLGQELLFEILMKRCGRVLAPLDPDLFRAVFQRAGMVKGILVWLA